MKNIFLFSIVLFSQIALCDVVFEDVETGFSGSIGAKWSSVDNNGALLLSPAINLLIKPDKNHRISSGLELNYLVTNTSTETSKYRDGMQFGYGGLRVGYTPFPDFIAHPSASILVGGGSVKTEDSDSLHTEIEDEFFVVEPELDIELNLTSFLRISGFIGYLFISAMDHPTLNPGDLSGLSVGIKLNFGSL